METPKPYRRGIKITPEAFEKKERNYTKGVRGFSRVDEVRDIHKVIRLTSTQEDAVKDFCKKMGISFSTLVRTSIAREMSLKGYIFEVEDDARQGNLFQENE